MKTEPNVYQALPEFLKKAIDSHIAIATEEEFEEAKKRLDKRKTEIITGAVLYVQKMVEFQSMTDRLIITVKV